MIIHATGPLRSSEMILTEQAPYAGRIVSVRGMRTEAGNVVATVKVNGVPVRGLSRMTVGRRPLDVWSNTENTFSAGDQISLIIQASAGAADLHGQVTVREVN